MNIYIGNLHYGLQENDLREVFEDYGDVDSVKIIMDRETGRSKGFGFVTMNDGDQAEEAIKELDGAEVNGRAMRVSQAKENNRSRGRSSASYGNRY